MDKQKELAAQECEPCTNDALPLALPEANKLLSSLDQSWAINEFGHLERTVLLKNFSQSLKLAVKLGDVAERAGHHPELLVSYGKLGIEIWTHHIGGLSKADFILAARLGDAIDGF